MIKLAKLKDLKWSEKLLAALLRSDDEAKIILLEDRAGESIEDFAQMTSSMHFSGLIMERLAALNLNNSPIVQAIAKALSDSVRREYVSYISINKQFLQLRKLLEKYDSDVLWLKGTSLARSVYEKPEHRISNDFDILIPKSLLVQVTETLINGNYKPVMVSAFCNQLGVGPVDSVADLLIAPDERWLPVSTMTFASGAKTMVDLSVSATNRGLKSPSERLILERAVKIHFSGSEILAPDPVYQLLIACRNLEKDRFRSWVSLFDVHAIATSSGATTVFWEDFIRIAKEEHLEFTAWSALWLASDRFHTNVPNIVMESLQPTGNRWQKTFMFTVSPTFNWNGASVITLLLNASVSSDCSTKLSVLKNSMFPATLFLQRYYRLGNTYLGYPRSLLLHWFVLLFPGGIVRRTPIGKAWKAAALESFDRSAEATSKAGENNSPADA